MHSENNGTKVWSITCLFGREYKFTPWSCNIHTLQITTIQSSKQYFNLPFKQTSHKIIEQSNACEHAKDCLFGKMVSNRL